MLACIFYTACIIEGQLGLMYDLYSSNSGSSARGCKVIVISGYIYRRMTGRSRGRTTADLHSHLNTLFYRLKEHINILYPYSLLDDILNILVNNSVVEFTNLFFHM